jgi:alpha-ketoglutarate-dependent taurine dioxygenase
MRDGLRALPRALGLTIEPASETLGAIVTGLDVRDDTQMDSHLPLLKSLVRERKLVLFRNQSIDEDALERFGQRFGTLGRSVSETKDGVIDKPTVQYVTNLDQQGRPSRTPYRNSNYFWHSDRLVFRNGLAMVMLFGVELPPRGGDTQWADMAAAYEGLSEADRLQVDSLRAVHSFEYMRNERMHRPLTEQERRVVPDPIEHPLVRTDPDTGRRSLLLGMYACEIVGLPTEAARALIARLEEHATRPEYLYTHVWRPGDFAIWDNLSTMHRALPNYDMEGCRRIMMRCAVEGERPIQ